MTQKWEVWEHWVGTPPDAGREDARLIVADTIKDAAIKYRSSDPLDSQEELYAITYAVAIPGQVPAYVRVIREPVPHFYAEECTHG